MNVAFVWFIILREAVDGRVCQSNMTYIMYNPVIIVSRQCPSDLLIIVLIERSKFL